MIIKLSEQEYHKILKQAEDEFPKEACGLMAGLKREDEIEITEAFPMTNVDDSAEHFSMNPEEQFAVVKEIRAKDYELIGNYHSHPYTPSRPSKEDKRLAYDEDKIYFILSLKDEEPVLKAFEIMDQQHVTEIELEIVDSV
ncbi:M67 family metallopeptidase [Sporohalobacter salinus]|uniref:M67 family metallopeptidase n=1 Tax=Sporohalobacter salinus TaxID=1494606 RepID=UPI0019617CB4|nr:M67 family metallopeptidase [Sporohalobacter salinus]MBM7624695.1 proteasome lid subunit RPN8/RPN11 [Sporohalobacter salinus]